jgi:hypothetical protein
VAVTSDESELISSSPSIEAVACHEIGHAIVGILNGRRPKSIVLAADHTDKDLGSVTFEPLPNLLRQAASTAAEAARFLPYIEIELAGPAAEAITEGLDDAATLLEFGERPGWDRDVSIARELAARATGLDDNSNHFIAGFEDQEEILASCLASARTKLCYHWPTVRLIMVALITKGRLNTEDIGDLEAILSAQAN